MKLVEICFPLNRVLTEAQAEALFRFAPLHVVAPRNERTWVLFRVPDDYEVPE